MRRFTLALVLLLSTPTWAVPPPQSCPDPLQYAAAPPTLLTTLDPFPLLAACAETVHEQDRAAIAASPVVYQVTVNTDGSFSPEVLIVDSGATVEWLRGDHSDTVIRSTWPGSFPAGCLTPAPYGDKFEKNEITGPMPDAPGGLFSLSPNPKGTAPGLAVAANTCGQFEDRGSVGNLHLCASGLPGATMATTWTDPAITGVFIRMRWDQIEPTDGDYDYAVLEREVNEAVANGKLFSLAFEAGQHGTPSWLEAAGVTLYSFRDQGSHPDDPAACGPEMRLGAPWDPIYKQRYFDMLRAVAAHLKTRADWYRALAYIKPSGANLFTSENRLPNGCEAGCCSDAEWASAGYRRALLEGFYAEQFDVIANAFPTKAMAYELIQAGFPRINDDGGYLDENGVLTAGIVQLDGTIQTETILDLGQAAYPDRFTVQHAGLQPIPGGACPGDTGCPNEWVIDEGDEGQRTIFQTQNIQKIVDLPLLDEALRNGELNSDAVAIEIYEERVWEAQQLPGAIGFSNRDLSGWDQFYRDRRAEPLNFRRKLTRTEPGNSYQRIYYINGDKCDPGAPELGLILIRP